jgi:NAD(P)-dependent dehydrogenase (short-subunit alcohol dehydrogenase family)
MSLAATDPGLALAPLRRKPFANDRTRSQEDASRPRRMRVGEKGFVMTLSLDFTGKTVLVCGVHKGGMGGAACRQIVRGGGSIIALDNNQGYVDEIAAELRDMGGTCHTLTADLMDIAQCEQVIPRVLNEFGPIDGLANVAGGTRADEWMPLDETPGESFWKTLQLNFAYVFYLCRDAAAEWIRTERPGAIVNVGSVSAKDGAPWHGPYGAAKSGIIALTRTMANEWHEFSIRANSVSPGAVMSARVLAKSQAMSDRVKSSRDPNYTPIFAEPIELANAITFLLSDLASGISGQNLTVDRSLSTAFCAGGRQSRKNTSQA